MQPSVAERLYEERERVADERRRLRSSDLRPEQRREVRRALTEDHRVSMRDLRGELVSP